MSRLKLKCGSCPWSTDVDGLEWLDSCPECGSVHLLYLEDELEELDSNVLIGDDGALAF